jgi:hypothetical protein
VTVLLLIKASLVLLCVGIVAQTIGEVVRIRALRQARRYLDEVLCENEEKRKQLTDLSNDVWLSFFEHIERNQ